MDKSNFPYGEKTNFELQNIGSNSLNVLEKKKCKLILIGCNTLSCVLENNSNINIIKINECIIDEVKRKIKKGRVLVLCTKLTKKSGFFQLELNKLHLDYDVVSVKEFVNMVENNSININKIKEKLSPYLNIKYDAVILGCTHFYYLEEYIKELFMNSKIIHGFNNMEKKVKRFLKKNNLKNHSLNSGNIVVVRN